MNIKGKLAFFILGITSVIGGYVTEANRYITDAFYNYSEQVVGYWKDSELTNGDQKTVPVSSQPVTPTPKPAPIDPNVKKVIDGSHLEWYVPAGKNKIVLKYKEKNGRLILEYEFPVNPGERLEIKAVEK